MKPAPELPAVVASRYLPLRLIGKGGMGAVYEVEHARTGERLALKILLSGVGATPETLERFKREARASARIKSEHVVRVTDADVAPELGGMPFLVMELLEGVDLERAVATAPPSPATVVDWLRQVARAIDKAHSIGIVHRDLKPENLFLARADGRPPIVKILDFGIVKMAGEGTSGTGTGQLLGTPTYMAPEQASSSAAITSAVDRYALGLIAYRFLLGEAYYRTRDVVQIVAQLLHEPLEPPSKRDPRFGPKLDAWFMRACHRSPGERFGTATQQIEALAEALDLPRAVPDLASEPTLASDAGDVVVAASSAGRSAPRRRTLAIASVTAVIAIVATVVAVGARRSARSQAVAETPRPAAPIPKTSSNAGATLPAAAAPAEPAGSLAPPAGAAGASGAAKTESSKTRASSSRRAPSAKPVSTTAPEPVAAPPPADPYADQK